MLKALNISSVGKDCVGCGNCNIVCPIGAVSLKRDQEGFLYPSIDECKCVSCGKCKKFCPQLHDWAERGSQEGYVAITKNKEIYKRSASGGAFGSIAYSFLQEKGNAACGAAYTSGQVKHVLVNEIDNLNVLQGSKYVQSVLENCFLEIKKILDAGSKVLFSGTPCQVAALKTFLGENTNGLYTIDLICHGVPSPAFLEKDLTMYVQDEGIESVQFRKKHRIYKSKSHFFLTLKRERSEKVVVVPYNRDPYFNLFMEGKSFRYSCYNCHYAKLNRVGDITLGDCDSSADYPDFHGEEATNTVIVNNEKGKELLEKYGLLLDMIPLNVKREAEKNHQLSYSSKMPDERQGLYERVNSMTMEDIRKKYSKPYTLKGKLYQWFNLILPPSVVKKIIRKR